MYKQITSNKRKSFLLIVVFIVFIILLGYAIDYISKSGSQFLIIGIIIASIMSLIGYYKGDKIALWTNGAKKINKNDNIKLYRIVENLCITSGLPMPKIYIINDSSLNAFSTGRNPKKASIAVTTGLLKHLNKTELQGVIAHELSHIKNYDILFMTMVGILLGSVTIISDLFIRKLFWFGGNNRNSENKSNPILVIIGLILIILSPIIAKIIQLSISRKREFLADADAALLTRYPNGLANALQKIQSLNVKTLKKATTATAHLYISNPFKTGKNKVSTWFSTHPPIEQRIKKLNNMEKNL
jgi:heat shock protein HtpX